ncbi:MAG TPA: hypothetical protein VK255_03040 [Patescibacteria group bacterium]|nr:hypothetical protein [Patescibacteria group bacterium]
MNIKISPIAAFVVLLLAGGVFLTIFLKSYDSYKNAAIPVLQKAEKEAACKPRAFSGEANIKGWYVDNQQKIVQIDKQDQSKLPLEGDKIKIIDTNQGVEKKLKNSSKDKPEEITITGFLSLCNGTNLASINYKDGIFRPYIQK